MNKAEEIKIISDAAKKLGSDSYLGDALKMLIPHLETELKSDFIPNLLGLVNDLEVRAAQRNAHCSELLQKSNALDAAIAEKVSALSRLQRQIDEAELEINRAQYKAQDAISLLKSYL
jgi:uncharacterized protein YdcH (DUF465 family)